MKLNTYLTLCAKYYELDKPTAPKETLDFYMSFVRDANGPILEPMCGTGRFLLPMLQKGYDIEGYDASPSMLSILKSKANKFELKANVWEQFIEKCKCNKQYNLIIIPSSSFCLIIDDEKIEASLKTIYKQLNRSGKFVFEAEKISSNKQPANIWKSETRQRDKNSQIIFTPQHLPIENNIETIICKYELIESGSLSKTEIEELNVKKYNPGELIEKLQSIGFSKVITHKAYQLNKKPAENDEEIVYECIK